MVRISKVGANEAKSQIFFIVLPIRISETVTGCEGLPFVTLPYFVAHGRGKSFVEGEKN